MITNPKYKILSYKKMKKPSTHQTKKAIPIKGQLFQNSCVIRDKPSLEIN